MRYFPRLSDIRLIHRDIQSAADQFFGRPVRIDERVFQVFDVLTKKGRSPLQVHLWQSLINEVPAVGDIYDRLGADMSSVNTPWPKSLTRVEAEKHNLESIDWNRTFFRAFSERSASVTGKLSISGERIKTRGILSIEDLAISLITQNFFSGTRNHVLYYIAKAANRHESENDLLDFENEFVNCLLDLKELDKSVGQQQFLLYHDGEGFRIDPYGCYGFYNLQESPLPDGSLWVARGNLIQPPKRFTREAAEHLEHLINNSASEREFQLFFEKHHEFLLALGDYSNLHSQLILHEDTGKKLIPDFFLEKFDSDFCDILDLKKANVALVREQPRRRRFRDAVMEAVAQLGVYRDWFDDKQNREWFHSRYGLKAFRPRVVAIIGRTNCFYDEMEHIRLLDHLPRWVRLHTYDEVVAKARYWKKLLY